MFEEGLNGRPLLSKPTGSFRLKKQGTKISIKLSEEKIDNLLKDETPNSPYFRHTATPTPRTDDYRSASLRKLICYLCPTSDTNISTKYGEEAYITTVTADDWVNLTDEEFLQRSRTEKVKLSPLLSESGEVLGRVGVSVLYSSPGAAITVKGVRGGELNGLSGIVKAKGNNHDAQRINASVIGNIKEWRCWARSIVEVGDLTIDRSLQIHPLIPEYDFPVWTINSTPATLLQVRDFLNSVDEIIVHIGNVTHDDEDDVSSSRFNSLFEPAKNLVCTPSSHIRYWMKDDTANAKNFPWALGVKPINYTGILEHEITEAWGGYLELDESDVVGNVDGVEICRSTYTYRRSTETRSE